MDIYKYVESEHPKFSKEIKYFLDSEDHIVFGGFVRSLLSNEVWNKELDVLCFDFEEIYKKIVKIFPPDELIEYSSLHSVFRYGDYRLDIAKIFVTNDFSFNVLGLKGENIITIPNIFCDDVPFILNQIDTRTAFESKICPNHKRRKNKYSGWTFIKRFN